MKTRISVTCAITALLLLTSLAPQSMADMVVFKNGRYLEGVIKNVATLEKDNFVELDMGVGTSKIPKSQLKEIEHTDNSYLEKKWRRENFANAKYVPEGFETLAKDFRRINVLRNDALQAARNTAGYGRMRTAITGKIDALNASITETEARLVATNASNKDAYNTLEKKVSDLKSQVGQLSSELEKTAQSVSQVDSIISAYTAERTTFKAEYAEQTKNFKYTKNKEIKTFLDQMKSELIKYEQDFATTPVSTKRAGGNLLVTANVNDDHGGTFIVDTGAAMVTISRDFARKAGIDLSTAREMQLVMADGRSVKGHQVILKAMSVAGHRSVSVTAAVLPNAPAPGVDGLLGMSFLKNYHLELQPGSGALTLRSL